MENQFKFFLEKGSRKFICPNCNQKTLVRYLSRDSSEYLHYSYGRCDREVKCGYHSNPYHNPDHSSLIEKYSNKNRKQISSELIPVPYSVLKHTQTGYEQNTFIQNLLRNVIYSFDQSDLEKIISLYQLGTITKGNRKGAITFPFIDVNYKIRAIQVKQFNEYNQTINTDFVHSILARELQKHSKPQPNWLSDYLSQEKQVTCLFGEHLLSRYSSNPIALVEAPKSAIYGGLYFGFPDKPKNLLWLAVYNLSSLTYEKCKVLEGRKVILFPDLSKTGTAFSQWQKKSIEIQRKLRNTIFNVSDLLETCATLDQKVKGLDIADYLIQLDWRKFRSYRN